MKEHGAVIIDGIQSGTTQRCPHCGGHFIVAASGTYKEGRSALGKLAAPRVYCQKCDRLTCGRPGCDPQLIGCIPLEAYLENKEGKKTSYDTLILERGF